MAQSEREVSSLKEKKTGLDKTVQSLQKELDSSQVHLLRIKFKTLFMSDDIGRFGCSPL